MQRPQTGREIKIIGQLQDTARALVRICLRKPGQHRTQVYSGRKSDLKQFSINISRNSMMRIKMHGAPTEDHNGERPWRRTFSYQFILKRTKHRDQRLAQRRLAIDEREPDIP